MDDVRKSSAFTKFAWGVVGYNLLVILWGVFLRASKSGDGCGTHWLTCHGEVIPSAPAFKTVIEFSHRVTSLIAGILVIILVILAFRIFRKGSRVRKFAVASLIFIILEGLVGAGLVLTGNTAENWTPTRPLWMGAHLINTFTLIAVLTMTAWFSTREHFAGFELKQRHYVAFFVSLVGIFLMGMSGSLAALSNMFFSSSSIAEGLAQDFDKASPLIVRLRISHPIVSVLSAIGLTVSAIWLEAQKPGNRWARSLVWLLLIQIITGVMTIFTGAPIAMQVLHLLLADIAWIAFILMWAEFSWRERVS
jgi:cytochrome c oxidase assembly protein subunit 15